MPDVLIIEDNKDLALGLKNNLEIEGYQVACASDGSKGLAALQSNPPKVIILDLMMPNLDGYEFLQQIKPMPQKPMILILSARDTEMDKVRGLRLGADDFVTKPFGLMELVARVEALIRRQELLTLEDANNSNISKVKNIEINRESRQVFKSGKEIELAPKEFDLLVKLIEKHGQVISRLELLKQVWGHLSAVESRTVDTHIGELRKKLEDDCSHPTLIKTVRKIGYRINI